MNPETLPGYEEKNYFREFMEDHNTATFPSKKCVNKFLFVDLFLNDFVLMFQITALLTWHLLLILRCLSIVLQP